MLKQQHKTYQDTRFDKHRSSGSLNWASGYKPPAQAGTNYITTVGDYSSLVGTTMAMGSLKPEISPFSQTPFTSDMLPTWDFQELSVLQQAFN